MNRKEAAERSAKVAWTTGHQRRLEPWVLWMSLFAGAPGSILALVWLWSHTISQPLRWTLTLTIAGAWLGGAWYLRSKIAYSLRTLANVLGALREGDYSLRVREGPTDDALGEVIREVNTLGDTLRGQRLQALEATKLLERVMEFIDVAIFAFDDRDRLRLVNRAGARLLACPAQRLHGRTASDLGLDTCLHGPFRHLARMTLPGGSGRWEIHRTRFRLEGRPHTLLVITDLSHALREEERRAWQRLIRVLSHELNNSMAAIGSTAATLTTLLNRRPNNPDWQEDMRLGLQLIASRAAALGRFMDAYARLARLPPPQPRPVSLSSLLKRTIRMETRLPVVLVEGPAVTIAVDVDQMEQALINLVRNAVDAALETGGAVRVGWCLEQDDLVIWIEDEGPGLPDTENLFVPFFTTKPGGTGIGLVLSRQIVEAHSGTLTLENRTSGNGCIARIRLPIK